MEPAHLLVHHAAAVADRGDEDLAREQVAAAEAALAVAAVGVDRDTRPLERHGHGLGRLRVDHILMDAAQDRDLEGLRLGALGVARQGGDVGGVIDHVVAEAAHGHAHVVQGLLDEAEHRQGAAEHIGAVGRGVLLDDLAGDKALLPFPLWLVREDVDDLHVGAGGLDRGELVLEDDVVCLDRAVENGELDALHLAVRDLLGHGVERRDAGAAGQGHELAGIAQGLPVEEAEGQRALEDVADLHVGKEIVGHQVRHVAADGDLEEGVLPSRLKGGGGDGVGPREDAVADLEAEIHILAALERGDVPVGGLEAEDAGGGGRLADAHDLEEHMLGMQEIGHLADGVSGIGDRRTLGEILLTELDDAGSAAYVLQKAFDLDAHFLASFFFSMSSFTPLAAARPLVICGPMPSPDMPCAPANSRPSMKWSFSFICSLATAWSSMEWR